MSRYEIKQWMLLNLDRFIDPKTKELNSTALTEAWDQETQDGTQTLDPDHMAWEVDAEIAMKVEKQNVR